MSAVHTPAAPSQAVPIPAVPADPVQALVAELHGVLARLEQQTGGQLDAVTDAKGRLFLLQHAQEQLRRRELSRQAAHASTHKLRALHLQRFGVAMDASLDAIYLIDFASLQFIHANDAACRLDGLSRAALLAAAPEAIFTITRSILVDSCRQLMASKNSVAPVELMRQRDGEAPIWLERRIHAEESDGCWTIVVLARDITARKLAEQRLVRLAHFDGLTGLPNRTLFKTTLQRMLARAGASGRQVALLFVDVDLFKNVNDTMGHAAGDELLRQLAVRLLGCIRRRDTAARLGGDEFALILATPQGRDDASAVARQINDAMRVPFILQGARVFVTTSIGVTLFPDDALDPAILLKYADTAMYKAKMAGRDTYRLFREEMNAEAVSRLALANALREAIHNGEFVLHYQPKMNLRDDGVAGVEALLRWNRPGHGIVAPDNFIAVLEATGLIVQVGRWVVCEVCRQIAAWMESATGRVHVAINICGRQFFEAQFEADIIRALHAFAVPPSLLELELTESSLMENTGRTIDTLHSLRRLGVHISIDDFGTGFSSLAYLRHFPLDKLKIDMAFIRELTSNANDAAIVVAIIGIAHSLQLRAVAEGVETAAQLDFLRKHHCDEVQGFYYGRPMPAAELADFLHAHPH